MRHPGRRTLMGFARGTLSEEKTVDLYAHLADCRPCSEQYLAFRSLATQFAQEWEFWLHDSAGSASSLSAVTPASAESDFVLAARILVNGVRGYAAIASSAISSWMASVSDFELHLEPGWVGTGAPDGGLPESVEASAALLADGRLEEAELALSDAAATTPTRVTNSTALAESQREGIEVRVHLESGRRALSLLLRGGEPARAYVWTATLFRENSGIIGQSVFSAVPGADFFLARLTAPEDGGFLVGVTRD